MRTLTVTDDELGLIIQGLETLQLRSLDEEKVVGQAALIAGVSTQDWVPANYFDDGMRKRREIRHIINRLRAEIWRPV